jgi:RNA polymerase sigma factor (sigma-70 family)
MRKKEKAMKNTNTDADMRWMTRKGGLDGETERSLGAVIQEGLRAQDEINNTDKLSATRRAQLWTMVERGKQAEQVMVESNIGLCYKCANRMAAKSPLSVEELMSAAMEGLFHAVRKFNPDRPTKFSTMAVWWIKQRISREVQANSRLIRLPAHMQDKIFLMSRLEEDQQNLKMSATEAGLSQEQVASAMRAKAMKVASLDAPVSSSPDNTATTQGERLVAEDGSPEELALGAEIHDIMQTALANLTEQERTLIELRHIAPEPQTLAVCATQLGISEAAAMECYVMAIDKLREDATLSALI